MRRDLVAVQVRAPVDADLELLLAPVVPFGPRDDELAVPGKAHRGRGETGNLESISSMPRRANQTLKILQGNCRLSTGVEL